MTAPRMTAEWIAGMRARHAYADADCGACRLLAELAAVTAERDALNTALVALTADVEAHAAAHHCERVCATCGHLESAHEGETEGDVGNGGGDTACCESWWAAGPVLVECICTTFSPIAAPAPSRTCACAQPTEAYGALAGPCPGCRELAAAGAMTAPVEPTCKHEIRRSDCHKCVSLPAPVEPMTAERLDLRDAPMGGVFSELRRAYAEIDALRAEVAQQRKALLAGYEYSAATLVYSYEELAEQRLDFEAQALAVLRVKP